AADIPAAHAGRVTQVDVGIGATAHGDRLAALGLWREDLTGGRRGHDLIAGDQVARGALDQADLRGVNPAPDALPGHEVRRAVAADGLDGDDRVLRQAGDLLRADAGRITHLKHVDRAATHGYGLRCRRGGEGRGRVRLDLRDLAHEVRLDAPQVNPVVAHP